MYVTLGEGDLPGPLVVYETPKAAGAMGKHRGGRRMGRSGNFE